MTNRGEGFEVFAFLKSTLRFTTGPSGLCSNTHAPHNVAAWHGSPLALTFASHCQERGAGGSGLQFLMYFTYYAIAPGPELLLVARVARFAVFSP